MSLPPRPSKPTHEHLEKLARDFSLELNEYDEDSYEEGGQTEQDLMWIFMSAAEYNCWDGYYMCRALEAQKGWCNINDVVVSMFAKLDDKVHRIVWDLQKLWVQENSIKLGLKKGQKLTYKEHEAEVYSMDETHATYMLHIPKTSLYYPGVPGEELPGGLILPEQPAES